MRDSRSAAGVLALVGLDLVSFFLSTVLAFQSRRLLGEWTPAVPEFSFSLDVARGLWWLPLVVLGVIGYSGLYSRRVPSWQEPRELLRALTLAVVLVLALSTLARFHELLSRLYLLLLWAWAVPVFALARFGGKAVLYRLRLWGEPTVIVGAGKAGRATALGLTGDPGLGHRILGFLDDDPVKQGLLIPVNGRSYPVLGPIGQCRAVVEQLGASTVAIAIPSLPSGELARLSADIQEHVRSVLVVPGIRGFPLANTELLPILSQRLFLLKIRNKLRDAASQWAKRTFDVCAALALLPVLGLAVGIIALAIRLDSPGGAFVSMERLGRGGRLFRCFKFRTMFENSDHILKVHLTLRPEAGEEWHKYKKLRDFDPRVTRVGAFLRKTSLDELPQILNVLRGEMSLVGPRPYLPREREDMGSAAHTILLTRPGITGLWQVSGRNALTFGERLGLDTWYVLNWSPWLDFAIAVKTIRVVLLREGAC
ncbi:MAG: undecaprenyl-phosphate galactose phosphotransferase WbaP [Thermodesulfobacteriota bacterium]